MMEGEHRDKSGLKAGIHPRDTAVTGKDSTSWSCWLLAVDTPNFWNGSMTKSPCKKQKPQNSPWTGGGVGLGRVRQRSGSAPAPAPSPEGSCQGSHHPTELPARPGCSPPAQGTAGSLWDFCLETASDGGRPGGSEGGTRRGQGRRAARIEGMGKGWRLEVFKHGKVLSRIYPKAANLH